MEIICLDLEGVLIPEIWIAFAEKTGIEELKLTTRNIPDYDELMQRRLKILDQHQLGLNEIQAVIDELTPMPGAKAFLDWLEAHFQVVILSDTFYEFAHPLMRQLGFPTLFCHRLEIGEAGKVLNYRLRMPDHKREAVQAFQALKFRVIAAGDSYNDTRMLGQADQGILFKAPQNVIDEFPQFPVVHDYEALKDQFRSASNRDLD